MTLYKFTVKESFSVYFHVNQFTSYAFLNVSKPGENVDSNLPLLK